MKYFELKEVKIPELKDFTAEIFELTFPSVQEHSATNYAHAVEDAITETGLKNSLEFDSNIFRLKYELAQNSFKLFGINPKIHYIDFHDELFKVIDTENNTLDNWLNGSTSSIKKWYRTVSILSYLIFSTDLDNNEIKEFLVKCLGYLGITNIDDSILDKMSDFNWDELGERAEHDGRSFTRLGNKAIIIFSTAIMTILRLVGNESLKDYDSFLNKFHKLFEDMFTDEAEALEAINDAEKALFSSNRIFYPRSISLRDTYHPQDFFVLQQFKSDVENECPFSAINYSTDKQSVCQVITAKTGMGKSAFIQMSTLCMLADKYEADKEMREALHKIADEISLPKDMFIISVPANMFSACYAKHKEWTKDFVTLFFNCMWKASKTTNFYSDPKDNQWKSDNINSSSGNDYTVTDELQKHIKRLAEKGKLLLILDSFDEISSGAMRTAYIKALADFTDKYCWDPLSGNTGAHIVVSTRKMSPQTMNNLYTAMGNKCQVFEIEPLDKDRREKLINKWGVNLGFNTAEIDAICKHIESNHYYRDYSVNPYMLSVICSQFKFDLKGISKRFIDYLVNRMRHNHRNPDPAIFNVFANIEKILQDVAGETITEGKSHFSRATLERRLKRDINKEGTTAEEIENFIEELHEIFTTEVGLIVPADEADDDYQFINEQIRYELGAMGYRNALNDEDQLSVYRTLFNTAINNIVDYVGMLVPLLCLIGDKDVELAEMLVSDLAMYNFKDEAEEELLISTMLDLVLARYGSNITRIETPSVNEENFIRRAQRIILIRILSSPSFKPTEQEKQEILLSPAYRNNVKWFSPHLQALLK